MRPGGQAKVEEFYVDEIKPVKDVVVNNPEALKIIDSLKAIIDKNKQQEAIEKLQKQIDSIQGLKEN